MSSRFHPAKERNILLETFPMGKLMRPKSGARKCVLLDGGKLITENGDQYLLDMSDHRPTRDEIAKLIS